MEMSIPATNLCPHSSPVAAAATMERDPVGRVEGGEAGAASGAAAAAAFRKSAQRVGGAAVGGRPSPGEPGCSRCGLRSSSQRT